MDAQNRVNIWNEVRTLYRRWSVLLLILAMLIVSAATAGCAGNAAETLAGVEGNIESVADRVQVGFETSETTAVESRTVEALPFVNIIEADNSDLTITWDGLTEDDLPETEALMTEIKAAVDAFSEEGYSTGFLLYDLNSGGGISYHADESYYSASAIKGPYVAWLVQAYPETADILYGTIQNTIQWSSNDDYETLITLYGSTEFNNWAAGLGCDDIAITENGILRSTRGNSPCYGILSMTISCRKAAIRISESSITERCPPQYMRPLEKNTPCTRRQAGSAKGLGHIIMYRMTRGSC